jgi:hypothetical protein
MDDTTNIMTDTPPRNGEGQSELVSKDLLSGVESSRTQNKKDVVMTPTSMVTAIVRHFKPSGRILDPCAGRGAFANQMPGCSTCEIQNGSDFFEWREPVDWIVSNPPYSIFYEWMCHSFEVADDIVYLIPLHKIFSGSKYLDRIFEFGGVKEVMSFGSARIMEGFPVGFAIGAVHFKRNYRGQTLIWRAA